MSDDIIYVDSYDFDTRIEHGVTVVFFFSQWCAKSRGMMPLMEEIADEYYDYLRVLALDVEQSPDVASIFAIESTPTVIFFRDGHIIEKLAEANPKDAYIDVIEALLLNEE